MVKVLIPIPSRDFDPSETAVPWYLMKKAGFEIVFATPDGSAGKCDEIMLDGIGLDIWGNIPALRKLVLFGRILSANSKARTHYLEMEKSPEFQNPIKWGAIKTGDFDGVIIPGGHRARGMRQFLESEVLQGFLADFIKTDKPIGAVCHGPLLLARSIDKDTQKSILYDRKCTALTWNLEKSANNFGNFLRYWDKDYYRTYKEDAHEKYGAKSVESEIKSLIQSGNFISPPLNDFKINSGLFRDTENDFSPSFIVIDKNLITARWPGDIHAFAYGFINLFGNRRENSN